MSIRTRRALAQLCKKAVLAPVSSRSVFFLPVAPKPSLPYTGSKRLGQPHSSPAQVGNYKIGKPYEIAGQWYYPAVDYEYSETGIASWYGPKFHGKQTANGEIFDQHEISAAHRTLPLPSMVRVTNLENGRSLDVRVNDRGPFAHGRIIDMSRRAAQLLGFENREPPRSLSKFLNPKAAR